MLEGSLLVGTTRVPAISQVRAFAVTDPTPIARREIIDPAKCDACHGTLIAHGATRRGAASCVVCHTAARTNRQGVARREGSTVLAESVDFKVMIHKLHMGARLSQPWDLGGTPVPTIANPDGTPLGLGQTRYPRSPAQCTACHVSQASVSLPLPRLAPSTIEEFTCSEDPASDPDNYCTAPFWTVTTTTRLPPETAVCTSCHDQPWTTAHAQINTSLAGVESCTTCHGPGAAFDVALVH
jgi:OmcA/MtrC family decaheme c-type cytochrome